MERNIDSMKPILLVDISMNHYANIVFNTLQKYDDTIPEGSRNLYFIRKYRDLEHHYMKKFFRICSDVDKMTNSECSEDIAYMLMDEFEEALTPYLDKVEEEIGAFLDPDTNDPDNIFLLRKIQMNSVMLQLAIQLNKIYNKKNDSTLCSMFEINTLMTEKIDDRKIKKDYSTEGIDKAIQELVNKVKTYKYE